MLQNHEQISYLIYGQSVKLKINDKLQHFVLMLCFHNHSFFELIQHMDFEIKFYVNIYHLKNVIIEKENRVILRLKEHGKNLKIYMPNAQKANQLKENLEELISAAKASPFCEFSIKNLVRYVLYYTRLANIEGEYSKSTMKLMMDRMHMFFSQKEVKEMTQKTIKDGNKITNYDFRRLFRILFLKPELADIFKDLLSIPKSEKIEKKTITFDLFYEKFVRQNNQHISVQTAKNFMNQIERVSFLISALVDIEQVDFDMFTCFLFSPLNQTNLNLKNQTFDAKLNDFYVGTSYRPELVGFGTDQKIKLEGIQIAIENHSRFIEIRCHDGPNGRPMLTNNPDSKNAISMEKTLNFINEIAFKNTQTPLILGIENYCSKKQRSVLGELIGSIFKSRLYYVTKDSFLLSELPPVSTLMGKVLIKTIAKYPLSLYDSSHKAIEQVYEETLDAFDNNTSIFQEKKSGSGLKTIFGIYEIKENDIKKVKLDIYTLEVHVDFHKVHLAEINLEKVKDQSLVQMWNLGVNFVGVNHQKFDENCFLHQLLFEKNGKNGFIHKPNHYIKSEKIDVQLPKHRKFTLKIVSGQILHSDWKKQHEQFFPYVKVRLLGTKFDTKNNPMNYTTIAEQNPFHCEFDWADGAESKKYDLIRPELDVLLFEVVNAKTEEIIKRGLIQPHSMIEGVKSVILYDAYNHFDSFSALVVRIKDTI